MNLRKTKKEKTAALAITRPNPEEFGSIYADFRPKIFKYFFYRVNQDHPTAEDLTQDTFLKALEQLPKFKDKGVPYINYLFTIAHNLLINFYRAPKTYSLETAAEMVVEMDMDKVIEEQIVKAGLWARIKNLMPKEQELIILRYAKQLSIREIAVALNKSENAVKIGLSRLQRQLVHKLGLDAALPQMI